ncbi:hypothetical protein DSM104635_01761 [Terricaulis silvestris]|uniref:Non-reducing end beta-L-arabinofuranosidase n=1 Tax=Terricaulis silvestris TaxID=2686094 RepID=A0A6I6MNM3_9CAUL|nr:hypothetical protein DSM104635_01761 [Terricaulis silvestris]
MLQRLPVRAVSLSGEFGRRIDAIINQNILALNLDEVFLAPFRDRGDKGYIGFGKFIDAVCHLAATTNDPRLVELKRRAVDGLIATQEPDGYIGIIKEPAQRVQSLWDLHEGAYLIWGLLSDYILYENAAALDTATRLADFLIDQISDPSVVIDSRDGLLGFEIAALGLDRALIRLFKLTGDEKYLDFAKRSYETGAREIAVQHDLRDCNGHAYTFLSNRLAELDLFELSHDARLLSNSYSLIEFLTKQDGLLVTGSCSLWESFHNTQVGVGNVSETCAGTYVARFMDAMVRIAGDSLYGDILERDIYNALFAATTPDGRFSRYHTPFEGERCLDPHAPRFCCANNNKRFLADLSSWIYYLDPDEKTVVVNLYSASRAKIELDGVSLVVEQDTAYPRNGDVRIKVDPSTEVEFTLKLRIPRWCKSASFSINGGAATEAASGAFHAIKRVWKTGDTIELRLPMAIRFVRGRRAQFGRVAVMRGPVIYTYNPEQNTIAEQLPNFDIRAAAINPDEAEMQIASRDLSGATACNIAAWPPSPIINPYPQVPQTTLTLTEYPDPGGRAIYFLVPNLSSSALVDDELISAR